MAAARTDTTVRQVDAFARLLAEVVIEDGEARLVVAKLEHDTFTGSFWLTRILGKRSSVATIAAANAELERIALAYAARVEWQVNIGENPTV